MANSGGVYSWSRTANNNANADNTVNYAEGQAPSTLNDSARSAMASVAKYRDDIAGAIVTGGTSTAYTVSSFQDFDSLSDMNGMVIAFSPHATNGAGPVTLNVDGLSVAALRSSPGVELPAGVLVQGTPYLATFSNADSAWYLQSFYGSPYLIPLGAGIDFWGSTAPNTNFAFAAGQAISRTTYAALFSMFGTAYGSGDGTTTFNIPDKRGRVSAAADNMGGSSANRLTSSANGFGTAPTLSAVGGGESETLSVGNLPTFTPAGTITNGAITFPSSEITSTASGGTAAIATGNVVTSGNLTTALGPSQASSTFAGTPIGSDTPFPRIQPTILCNYIIRIL